MTGLTKDEEKQRRRDAFAWAFLPLLRELHEAGSQAFRPPPGWKARQRSNFAPPRPDYPAAS
jgi:hypothetical protein